jgi:hypothetical protein
MELTPEEKEKHYNNTEGLFKEIEKTRPDRISDIKLKCTFLPSSEELKGVAVQDGDKTETKGPSFLSENALEEDNSRLRQDVTRFAEENGRLKQEIADLQRKLTNGNATAINSKMSERSSSSPFVKIIALALMLLVGMALGIWIAPGNSVASGEL